MQVYPKNETTNYSEISSNYMQSYVNSLEKRLEADNFIDSIIEGYSTNLGKYKVLIQAINILVTDQGREIKFDYNNKDELIGYFDLKKNKSHTTYYITELLESEIEPDLVGLKGSASKHAIRNGKYGWDRNFYGEASRHALYRIWTNMVGRCTNPVHDSFERYQNTRINPRFLDTELGYLRFYRDLLPAWEMAVNKYGLTTSLDIDRKNNSGGYFKSNIRFVPRVVNIRNRANTVMVELSGKKSMPLAKACEKYGISYTKAYNRIKTLGWSHDQAFGLAPRTR